MKKLLLTCLLSALYVLTASAQTRWMNPLEQGETLFMVVGGMAN